MKPRFIMSAMLLFAVLLCAGWSSSRANAHKNIEYLPSTRTSMLDVGKIDTNTNSSSIQLLAQEQDNIEHGTTDELYNASIGILDYPKIYTGGDFKMAVQWSLSKPDKNGTVTVGVDGEASGHYQEIKVTSDGRQIFTFKESLMKSLGLHTRKFQIYARLRSNLGNGGTHYGYVNGDGNPQPKVPPVVTLFNKDSDYDGQDYVLTGQWKDEDSKSVDLFYTIDGGSPVKFSSPQNQPVNQWYDYSTTIKAGVMAPTEKHVIQVYAVDTETLKSNVETVTLSPKVVKQPPTVLLYNKDEEYDGEDYTLTGLWVDDDSNWVDLYYQIDNSSPVKFGSQVPNDEETNDFEHTIKKGIIDPSVDHKIIVYAIDDTELKSNIQSVTLTARKGELLLQSYPIDFSFGDNLKVPLKDTSYPVDYMNGDLIVSDTRSVGQTWSMTARVIKRLEGDAGSLEDALYFYKDGQEYQMKDGISIPVIQHETINDTPVNVSENWDSVDNGFRLKIPGNTINPGNYSGNIEWTLNDVPLNK